MSAVVFGFLVFNVWLAAAVLYSQWKLRRSTLPPVRRLTAAELAAFCGRQLFLAGALAFTFLKGDWTLASVGVHSPGNWLEAVLAGEIAYLVLVVVYTLLMRVSGILPAMHRAAARGNLRAWPRKPFHKVLACIFIMGFNPFTEELVMRGILIHHWSLLLESASVPIVIGFALNAVLHGYQGWRMQLWHAMYFAMAVFLLYSPWGLVAAITAHVIGDVAPIVSLRRQQRLVRKQQRKERAARAAQAA